MSAVRARTAGVVAALGCALAACTATAADEEPDPRSEELRAVLEEWSGEDRKPIAVGFYGPDGDWVAAVGVDENDAPITPDQPWGTASMAKLFTAAAVMQLVESGDMELDGLLEEYVPFPVGTPVTIRHLLQHQSGLPDRDFDNCDYDGGMASLAYAAATDWGSPGAGSYYANINYAFLGVAIATVTGTDVGVHIREHVFEPLRMESTYFFDSQEGPDAWWIDERECGPLLERELGGPVGGAVTTLADMDRFLRGLFEPRLFDQETLDLVLTLDTELFGLRFGLGVAEMVDEDHPGYAMHGFGGTYGGMHDTRGFYDPDRDRTVVVSSTVGDHLWDLIDWADGALESPAP